MLRRSRLGTLAGPIVIALALAIAQTAIEGREDGASSWGGPGCPAVGNLRALVDTYLATRDPFFSGGGPNIPGASLAVSRTGCGTFSYAAGWSKIERAELLTPATRMQIASMTKAIVAAVALQLSDSGAFGPQGLGATVNNLLTPSQIQSLTVGDDPSRPRCPGFTYLFNRDTGRYEWTAFSCPDLSRVTLRDLMRANHGMYDFFNEVRLPDGRSQPDEGIFFDLDQYLGLNPMRPPNPDNGFDVLKWYGLKQNNSAVIGGVNRRDFEVSLGNTGFQLLGIILEQTTGETLDALIGRLVVQRLGLDSIEMYLDPARQRSETADGYVVVDGTSPVPGVSVEQAGVYPIVDFHDNTEVNTLNLGLGKPGNFNTGGGSGGLIANPHSYRRFLEAFVDGGLLGPAAQRELKNSFVPLSWISTPQVTYFTGFGLLKNEVRNLAGTPDRDAYWHNGSIVGAMCDDTLVNAPDSSNVLFTFVVCQNVRPITGTFDFPNIDNLSGQLFFTLLPQSR